ncbi:methyltransferase [Trichlorobacter ammonificans]|uniref:Enzyme n=1 Tax=Trichlorobacter ammonificans TaxID=2916410 RepID=A0ABM9D9F6_9BACT|nr:methyltransferase [Trichlorobacter ammonificans]CAH2031354.1 putative enzyme [Trichlorobacter ammonificans]
MATEQRTAASPHTGRETGSHLLDHLVHVASKLGMGEHLANLANELMGRDDDAWADSVALSYDFSRARTIVDVGGGTGTLMTAILQNHPGTTGIIFDSPAALAATGSYLLAQGVADRCRTVAGDMFRNAPPAGGDIYILSNILSDWEESRALQILRACSSIMAPESRVLVIERLMPQRQPATATVAVGGSVSRRIRGWDRTEADYRRMLAKAWLQVRSLVPFTVPRTMGSIEGTIIESRLLRGQVTCTADIDDYPLAGFLWPVCLTSPEFGHAVA